MADRFRDWYAQAERNLEQARDSRERGPHGRACSRPMVVAIDGRSGAGKSTLASKLAEHLDATVVPGDDFYAGGVAVPTGDPATLWKTCIDWKATRAVLTDLIEGGEARYHGFDWAGFDGSPREEETLVRARRVVILEGVYSARFELRDLVDLAILLRVPEKERLRRLLIREGQISEWEAAWHRAEDWYFSKVAPPDYFDLVFDNDED